ncbi:MAG: MATE family efflux transporter [Oscillospiraceae bacterium]|nr:MATE family efflux transporter [Oscillospiraceae bacterium]
MAMSVAVPIMLQSGIANFVSLLDNIMVGSVGTEQMTGVAITNQLLFVFNLCIFGATAGAGIFTTQYYGRGDTEAVRITIRYKMCISALLCVIGLSVFTLFGKQLIQLYLNGQSVECDAEEAMRYAHSYMKVMLIGLVPFAFGTVYAGTLRETGETLFPMKVSFAAVTVNLVLNWVLIFGHLGAPKMGVIGAAAATVVARFVEAGIMIWWTHSHKEKNQFAQGLFRHFRIPGRMAREMIKKGTPLLCNETLWSLGMAMLAQCFSMRGLDVMASYNISSTIMNFFSVVSLSLGNAIGIIVGHHLGARRVEEAKDSVRKLVVFSIASCAVCTVVMVAFAGLFTNLYNTTDHIKSVAKSFILIIAFCMPIMAFVNSIYFTLRSGGKTFITFMFDCCFMWLICVPLAFILVKFTDMSAIGIFAVVQYIELVKGIVGYILLKKGVWIRTFD